MKLGFTGTRNGMTKPQWLQVFDVLLELHPDEGTHGDCVGADFEFHQLVIDYGPVIIRPGPDGEFRAHCGGSSRTTILPEKTHFARNRDIVNACDVLLACPRLMTEEDRGGTWYTINYARKVGKPVIIVWPDGSETRERLK